MLGIPTVLDRLIQQAIHQILSPMWETGFSAHSYGFRPGRSAAQALKAAQGHIRSGKRWVVDMDLEKFFDRVNHDVLMARVARIQVWSQAYARRRQSANLPAQSQYRLRT